MRDRDINLAFNISKNSVVDEDVNPKIRYLAFYEFLEAIGRLADSLCCIPIYCPPK